MPFIFASIMLFVIIAFIIYTDVSSWERYINFANDWLELADAEQRSLDLLEKEVSNIINPHELMLYDSIMGFSVDAIKRRTGYAEDWMNKVPKWYLNAKKRFC